MPQESSTKVLFIAGLARSGSTLLDRLLGQISGYCSTGELRFIWDRGFDQNQLCGCGKPFKECELWTAVVKEGFGDFENVDYRGLDKLRASAESHISKRVYFTPDLNLHSQYQQYFDATRTLYDAIRKVSGCEVVVDSSKYVAYGSMLVNMPGIDLFTIHLLRDSRAVAHSWRRKKIRPEVQGREHYMSQRGLIKTAIRWDIRNILAHQFQRTSKSYAFLRYEDLVSNPEDSLKNTLANLGLETASLNALEEGLKSGIKRCHTISGNPMRFEGEEVKIQPDLKWQKDMPRLQRWLVTFLTWPLLLKYGYLKSNIPGRDGNGMS